MRHFCFGLLALLLAGSTFAEDQARLIEVRKIWDEAPHNAFTDLVRFQDRWFCVFREGKAHVSPDGALRVLTSTDGKDWKSAALITSTDSDLRDAKITVTPQGKLMLCGAGALHDRSQHSHQTLAWFSDNGTDWSEPQPIGELDYWLWRVTWHDKQAFGVGYSTQPQRKVKLYRSDDGKSFEPIVENLYEDQFPNEATIVFDADRVYCLLRRDGPQGTGLLGVASSPFTDWAWQDLKVKIGGPNFIRWSDGRFFAVVRLYDQRTRTAVCTLDPATGKLTELLTLPSGGDTSYAGLVEHDGRLWISYYSSHEKKASIYLAEVEIASR